MATYYFEYEGETIERITEQMIKAELLDIIEGKVSDVQSLYDASIVSLENDNENIKRLYDETLELVDAAKERIKENINMYVEENYYISMNDDGDGNIVFRLVKKEAS